MIINDNDMMMIMIIKVLMLMTMMSMSYTPTASELRSGQQLAHNCKVMTICKSWLTGR